MDLPEREAQVQQRSIAAVRADPEGFIARYREEFGNRISTDDAAELFAEYNASRDARTANRVAVQKAAQWIARQVYDRALEQPLTKDGRVVFTSGGTGSGKTTAVRNAGFDGSEIVYDSTLFHFEGAVRDIERALVAGRCVTILHVPTEPVEAYRRVLKRATEIGRIVSIQSHVITHRGAGATFVRLQERYPDDRRVAFVGEANESSYPGLERKLLYVLEQERAAGRVSDLAYSQAE